LVGKTSTGLSVTGTQITSDGRLMVTRDGNQAADFNRKSSDGDIVKFQKDGTTVGSIKARYDYTTLQIGSTGTGITGTSSHKILPSVNNARSDNTNDLGDSSYRWKDLYLSGGLRGDTLKFSNLSGSERMRIDSSGRLLLGTSTSFADGNSEDLQIAGSGNTGMIIKSGSASYGSIYFGDSTSGGARNAGIVRYFHNDNSMQFWTNETERMRIDSSGNVGIGGAPEPSSTSYNSATLHLRQVGSSSVGSQLRFTSGNSGHTNADGAFISYWADNNFYFNNQETGDFRFFSGGSERMRITSSGSLLAGATAQIGTGSHLIKAIGDTLALDVYTSTSTAGRDVFAVRSDIGGTETKVGVIEANGDFQSATNSYGSISDQSVKQDIVDANSQMEDVKNIRLRNYRLIDHVTAYGDDAKVHLGVVAQELEAENMNGLVSENADGVKGVRYSVMLLKALGALQETITMVEDLQAENTQIKARLTALEG